MLVYYDKSLEQAVARTHPWRDAEYDESARYYDFIKHPELIRTSLEDVLPFGDEPCAVHFYELIEWLNGPDSVFETNDCAMRAVEDSPEEQFPQVLRMKARLHLFIRDHRHNLEQSNADWLTLAFRKLLFEIDQNWREGCISITQQPVGFETFSDGEISDGLLQDIGFWAFGDTEEETQTNFVRCTKNVLEACQRINERIRADLTHREGSLRLEQRQ